MKLGVDVNRHKEIIVKAISAILLLLLKHFKLNHIYQVRTSHTSWPSVQSCVALMTIYSNVQKYYRNASYCMSVCCSHSLNTWLNTWCSPTASLSFWSSSTRTLCRISLLRIGIYIKHHEQYSEVIAVKCAWILFIYIYCVSSTAFQYLTFHTVLWMSCQS